MNKKYLNTPLYFWLAFLVSSLIFIFLPQIDLYVSGLFYDGKRFSANGTFAEGLFYYSVKPIILTLLFSTILIFLYNVFKKKNFLSVNAKVVLYVLLVLSIAPGLIVNAGLKENWERARPAQTVQFGGDKKFTPAFIISDQDGYSFSSGHGAAAFSLLGFALLATKRRKLWIGLALSYGVFVSVARIAAGGHFLSDVVTSFFIVYFFTYADHSMLIEKD